MLVWIEWIVINLILSDTSLRNANGGRFKFIITDFLRWE